jgi:hypothetical protein
VPSKKFKHKPAHAPLSPVGHILKNEKGSAMNLDINIPSVRNNNKTLASRIQHSQMASAHVNVPS